MKPLAPYWFRPGIPSAWLSADISNPLDKNSGIKLEPTMFKWLYPGACLFSRLEQRKGYTKVWLYNFKNSDGFKNSEDRKFFEFWVDSSLLVEMPMV